jgi:hypothetical protein
MGNKNIKTETMHQIERRIEAVAWGLFFIWVGIAFLSNLGDGVGLLGIGIITLGAQIARSYYNLVLETFWLIVGICFALGGIWEFMDPAVALVPVLLIVAGAALLYSVLNKSIKKTNNTSNE